MEQCFEITDRNHVSINLLFYVNSKVILVKVGSDTHGSTCGLSYLN